MDRDIGRPQIEEHHYSVHNSPNAPINTFKDTVVLNDGRKQTVKFLSAGIENDLFCFLFTRSVPETSPAYFDVVERPRDKIVSLGRYNSTKTTLVYSVIVSRRDRELYPLEEWGAHVKHLDFALYRISVLYSLLNLASPLETAIMMSASFEIGSSREASPSHPLNQGDHWLEINYAHFRAVNAIRRKLIEYIDHRSQTHLQDEDQMQPED